MFLSSLRICNVSMMGNNSFARSVQTRSLSYRSIFPLIYSIFLFLCVLCLFMPRAQANPLYASVVMDAQTGVILHQRHADARRHPASLTKVMTLVMVFEALDAGRLRLSDSIRISPHAASMVPSKLGLPAGSTIRVEDAIKILVTRSANDIAVAVAEHLGGTESRFAQRMTTRARAIGLNATTFRNASGLHHPAQVTTARDMARLARHVQTHHARHYHYFSLRTFRYRGVNYRNHNRLMETYTGMDGLKTGYIAASGFNLMATASRNNQRIIGVVFGGRSTASRNAHMADLLDRGFARLNEVRVAQAKIPLPPRKPDLPNFALASTNQQIIESATGQGDTDIVIDTRIQTALMAIETHAGSGSSTDSSSQTQSNPHPPIRTAALSSIPAQNKRENRPIPTPLDTVSRPPYVQNPPSSEPNPHTQGWSIQIGAFASPDIAMEMLRNAVQNLPRELANATPLIVPMQTGQSPIYRARLSGYARTEALHACYYFKECVAIAPPPESRTPQMISGQ